MDDRDIIREVRAGLAARERLLAPHAAREGASPGRALPEDPDAVRTAYQVDRDRILRTKAFRRLKHKTQVFIAPMQDHYVTRLTHTLEVAQVARTVARALSLNEDLSEAAALGHDIGHGPFGHAGEEALAECLPDGFRHNYQSVRVLELLENDARGLNLMFETRDAIEKSSKVREDMLAEGWGVPVSLEGQVVKLADAIAYINHDLEDAIRSGLLRPDDVPTSIRATLGDSADERLDTLMGDLIAVNYGAVHDAGSAMPAITMSPPIAVAANELREFLFQRVYHHESTLLAAQRGKRVVRFLFEHFARHPDAIPGGYARPDDPVSRRAADYVSGMTDWFAARLAAEFGLDDARGFIA